MPDGKGFPDYHRIGLLAVALIVAFLLTVACARATPTPAPSPTLTVPPAPSATPTLAAGPTPTQVVLTPTPAEGLVLKVLSVVDESVVRIGKVPVLGVTSVDAVVSINGELVTLDANGNFSVVITLEAGPNLIEVIASDLDGNVKSAIFTVIFFP